jgi:hypothetical protein
MSAMNRSNSRDIKSGKVNRSSTGSPRGGPKGTAGKVSPKVAKKVGDGKKPASPRALVS